MEDKQGAAGKMTNLDAQLSCLTITADELLRVEDYYLIRALFRVCEKDGRTLLHDACVLWSCNQAEATHLRFLMTLINDEVDETVSATTLFRSNTNAARLVSVSVKLKGYRWLVGIMKDWIQDMTQTPRELDIDPAKAKPGADLEANRLRLEACIQQILVLIAENRSKCPWFINELAAHLHDRVSLKFWEFYNRDTLAHPYSALGGMLHLRFLCPSVFAPLSMGLVDEKPSAEANKNLLLVSKVLQMMANGLYYSNNPGESSTMSCLNPFMRESMPLMYDFLESFVKMDGSAGALPSEEELMRSRSVSGEGAEIGHRTSNTPLTAPLVASVPALPPLAMPGTLPVPNLPPLAMPLSSQSNDGTGADGPTAPDVVTDTTSATSSLEGDTSPAIAAIPLPSLKMPGESGTIGSMPPLKVPGCPTPSAQPISLPPLVSPSVATGVPRLGLHTGGTNPSPGAPLKADSHSGATSPHSLPSQPISADAVDTAAVSISGHVKRTTSEVTTASDVSPDIHSSKHLCTSVEGTSAADAPAATPDGARLAEEVGEGEAGAVPCSVELPGTSARAEGDESDRGEGVEGLAGPQYMPRNSAVLRRFASKGASVEGYEVESTEYPGAEALPPAPLGGGETPVSGGLKLTISDPLGLASSVDVQAGSLPKPSPGGADSSRAGSTGNEALKLLLFEQDSRDASRHVKPVFGGELETLAEQEAEHVPLYVQTCVDWLEASDSLREVGLFRLAGSTDAKTALKKAANECGYLDLKQTQEEFTPHLVGDLLKGFLRELEEPVLIHRFYSTYVKVAKNPDRKKRLLFLRKLVNGMPLPNKCTILYLLQFLHRVALRHKMNKMVPENLATVLAPNLLWDSTLDPMKFMEDSPLINKVVQNMIEEASFMAGVTDDLAYEDDAIEEFASISLVECEAEFAAMQGDAGRKLKARRRAGSGIRSRMLARNTGMKSVLEFDETDPDHKLLRKAEDLFLGPHQIPGAPLETIIFIMYNHATKVCDEEVDESATGAKARAVAAMDTFFSVNGPPPPPPQKSSASSSVGSFPPTGKQGKRGRTAESKLQSKREDKEKKKEEKEKKKEKEREDKEKERERERLAKERELQERAKATKVREEKVLALRQRVRLLEEENANMQKVVENLTQALQNAEKAMLGQTGPSATPAKESAISFEL